MFVCVCVSVFFLGNNNFLSDTFIFFTVWFWFTKEWIYHFQHFVKKNFSHHIKVIKVNNSDQIHSFDIFLMHFPKGSMRLCLRYDMASVSLSLCRWIKNFKAKATPWISKEPLKVKSVCEGGEGCRNGEGRRCKFKKVRNF